MTPGNRNRASTAIEALLIERGPMTETQLADALRAADEIDDAEASVEEALHDEAFLFLPLADER